MMSRYILAWIPMVFIAIINGMIRQFGYGKYLSELRAHQVSTATGVLFFGFYIGGLIKIWPFTSMAQAIAVGVMWLILTVLFEFLFGHYVAKHPWKKLLNDYNLLAGRVWLIVLLWVAIAPVFFYRFSF